MLWLFWWRKRAMDDEDREDLAAFEERANEPILNHEELLESLRKQGKI